MEGRWTISKKSTSSLSPPYRDHVRGPEAENVPVVPCDDAAIERVARRIREQNLHLSLPTCFERARDYLLIAGETP